MSKDCGVFGCYPKCLQIFAQSLSFVIVYSLLGTIKSIGSAYFTVTLTTIERRFKIPSQTTGIVLSGNEVPQILLALIVSYAGGQRNRPQWIAWGVVFTSLSYFILILPHVLYGAGEEAFQLTQEYLTEYDNETTSTFGYEASAKKNNKLCQSGVPTTDELSEVISYLPLVLIFLSQFVLGIGNTLHYSLGSSYLDDNTRKTKTPFMLAFSASVRAFGPVIGYALAYFSLSIYINPTLTPLIKSDDKRWLGAWWFGWIIVGALMLLIAPLIAMFPKTLLKKDKKLHCTNGDQMEIKSQHNSTRPEDSREYLKNFSAAVMRLLTNKLFMLNTFSMLFFSLGSSGFRTFLSRIMEVQFNKTSAGGTIFTGPLMRFGKIAGYLLTGFVISKFNPPPKYLFFWNVIVGIVSLCSKVTYMQLGCEYGNSLVINSSMPTFNTCNLDCICDSISYSPVCDTVSGETFFSPCHAGCKEFDMKAQSYSYCSCSYVNSTTASKQFSNGSSSEYDQQEFSKWQHREITWSIVPGPCIGNCDFAYYMFSLTSLVVSLFASTCGIGITLLNFRAVEQRDKAFSQGFHIFVFSILSSIPGPIIFGRIIDSTCLIWSYVGHERGNCQLYDPLLFRYYLHGTAASLTVIGVFFDVLVWRYSKNLGLYGFQRDKQSSQIENLVEIQPLKDISSL